MLSVDSVAVGLPLVSACDVKNVAKVDFGKGPCGANTNLQLNCLISKRRALRWFRTVFLPSASSSFRTRPAFLSLRRRDLESRAGGHFVVFLCLIARSRIPFMAKSPNDRIGQVEEILCANCNRWTKHTIHGAYDTYAEDGDVSGGAKHDLMACNGCDSVTYRRVSWFSEEPDLSTALYPPRAETPTPDRKPKDFDCLAWNHPVNSVYQQTIVALNANLPTLAGAGVRLIIEGVCKDCKIVDGDVTDRNGVTKRNANLVGKINGMVEQGLIGKKQADVLHEIRFLGNDTAPTLTGRPRKFLTRPLTSPNTSSRKSTSSRSMPRCSRAAKGRTKIRSSGQKQATVSPKGQSSGTAVKLAIGRFEALLTCLDRWTAC